MNERVTKSKINFIIFSSLFILIVLAVLCVFLSIKLYNQKQILKEQEQIIENYNKDDNNTLDENG